jgi:hypothetical protein
LIDEITLVADCDVITADLERKSHLIRLTTIALNWRRRQAPPVLGVLTTAERGEADEPGRKTCTPAQKEALGRIARDVLALDPSEAEGGHEASAVKTTGKAAASLHAPPPVAPEFVGSQTWRPAHRRDCLCDIFNSKVIVLPINDQKYVDMRSEPG